jgi:hypothetical protein
MLKIYISNYNILFKYEGKKNINANYAMLTLFFFKGPVVSTKNKMFRLVMIPFLRHFIYFSTFTSEAI